jgi:hypothetical protein
MKGSSNFKYVGAFAGVILVVVLVVVLWPKKRKELTAGGWKITKRFTVTLEDPNATYTLQDIPEKKGSVVPSRPVVIKFPKGKTGDRMVIRGNTKNNVFNAHMGPHEDFTRVQVGHFFPGSEKDLVCDNTNGKWFCHGSASSVPTSTLPGTQLPGFPQWLSLLKCLTTVCQDGGKLNDDQTVGFELISFVFALFFGGSTSQPKQLSISDIANAVNTVVKQDLNTALLNDVQICYQQAAGAFVDYGYTKKLTLFSTNREYANSGDPSILNQNARTTLYNTIEPLTRETGNLAAQIRILCSSTAAGTIGGGYGVPVSGKPGFYTWDNGNNWLLLMTLLQLYMAHMQEASFVDINNKDTLGNFFNPWTSSFIQDLQTESLVYIVGCKTLWAMYDDYTNRYMDNIIYKNFAINTVPPTYSYQQGSINILYDANTLYNGGPVPLVTTIPPLSPYNYTTDQFGNIVFQNMTFQCKYDPGVLQNWEYYCSQNTAPLPPDICLNKQIVIASPQDPSGANGGMPIWAIPIDYSDGALQCPYPNYPAGPDPMILAARAVDFHTFHNNPYSSFNVMLRVGGFKAVPPTAGGPRETTFEPLDPPVGGFPTWWPAGGVDGISPTLPKGTPFLGTKYIWDDTTKTYDLTSGWEVNDRWNIMCVNACTLADANDGTNACATNYSSGPRLMQSVLTTNQCYNTGTDPDYIPGMTMAITKDDVNAFAHPSTFPATTPTTTQPTSMWGMMINRDHDENLLLPNNAIYTCLTNDAANPVTQTGKIGSYAGPANFSRNIVSGNYNFEDTIDKTGPLVLYPGATGELPRGSAIADFNSVIPDCVPQNYDSYTATVTTKATNAGITTYTFSSPTITYWKHATFPITIASDLYGHSESATNLTFDKKEWKSGSFTLKHSSSSKYAINEVVTVTVARVY